ncbi:amidohydrolase family protein [Roseateles sp.]|uniref:metal-dependent hydrolase family protein n=1 Tax=Roseateles sp. TaxID=1971397 RepID=UPI0025FD5C35|nr:amidohydrolase family protein [Roseateles sp.]MBV8036967.1 amidohydrolase family protein [Roseateles sp.]
MRRLALALLFAACHAVAAPGETLIHAGRLIDTEAGRVLERQSIIVFGDKISAVRPGYVEPAGYDRLIDLTDRTVMPGLIDMHVHVSGESSPGAYAERFFRNPADAALHSTVYLRRILDAGFTTVRDLGASDGLAISLRDATAKGWITGPRIFAAGKAIGTTGGHADPTNGLNHQLRGDPGPLEGVINGPDEARKAVRQRYKEGADLIKLTGTGGVLSLATNGVNPQFTDAELQAVVETARDYGFAVAVHAHGKEGMLRAIRAGVDSIEHGSYLDDEVVAAMRQHGTWLVPTLSAGRFASEKAQQPGYFPEVVRLKAVSVGVLVQQALARAWKGGVKIAFGTDSGVGPHGANAKEFGYLVEAGMPAMAAIQSATIQAAKLLRQDARLGAITPGRWADIVAVKGDPLADIRLMEKVDFVMQAGRVVPAAGR